MVQPDTYGQWQNTSNGYKKETSTEHITIEPTHVDKAIYCFIEHSNKTYEYTLQPVEYLDSLCNEIMKRESHGEDIIDILQDLDFQPE